MLNQSHLRESQDPEDLKHYQNLISQLKRVDKQKLEPKSQQYLEELIIDAKKAYNLKKNKEETLSRGASAALTTTVLSTVIASIAAVPVAVPSAIAIAAGVLGTFGMQQLLKTDKAYTNEASRIADSLSKLKKQLEEETSNSGVL